MKKKTTYVSPAIRALAGLVLVLLGLLFVAMFGLLFVNSVPVNHSQDVGALATAGILRGSV